MIMALAMDRIDFVKLFLNYGISIQALLTPDVLEFLYGYRSKGAHSILNRLIKKSNYLSASGKFKEVMEQLCSYEKYDPKTISISLSTIKDVVNDACSDFMRRKTDQFIEVINSKSFYRKSDNKSYSCIFLNSSSY